MPNTTLYSIITTEGSGASSYPLDQTMAIIQRHLQDAGIPTTVSNAIAGIAGRNTDYEWRLVSASRDPEIPSTGSAYQWDDRDRYFFRYENKSNPNSYAVILEYARLSSPFEIRGTTVKDGVVSDAKVTDQKVREAIIAMLLSILWTEEAEGYALYANTFRRNYADKFLSGPQTAIELVRNMFETLKSHADPSQGEAAAPFELENACLNQRNSKLKQVLEGEGSNGYLNGNTGKIHIAADSKVKSLVQSGDVTDDSTVFVEVMEGLLVPNRAPKVDKLDPFMYPIRENRVYTEDERARLLEIPDWYIPVQRIVRFAKSISESNIFDRPIRNLLLRGPAGCGKTEGARAIASMTGSPYGVVTGHAEMEFFDLTSMMIPRTDKDIKSEAELLEYLLYAVRDENFKMPSLSEISMFPDQAYQEIITLSAEDKLLGKPCLGLVKDSKDVTEADCIAALSAKLLQYCKMDASMFMGEQSKFKIIKSDLALGMEQGWLIELQEMNTLLKPGTLVGLNNIMEYGTLQLPTGEIIRRHPDTIIVFTQNVGYAGTVDGNQSVYSRIELKCDLKPPSEDEMVKRILMHVPQLNEADARLIVITAQRIRDRCGPEIEGGNVGTREEIAWAKMTHLYGDMMEAAEDTILPACSEDEEDINTVRESLLLSLNPNFEE